MAAPTYALWQWICHSPNAMKIDIFAGGEGRESGKSTRGSIRFDSACSRSECEKIAFLDRVLTLVVVNANGSLDNNGRLVQTVRYCRACRLSNWASSRPVCCEIQVKQRLPTRIKPQKASSTDDSSQLGRENEALRRQLAEAQSRENATSEILRVIASSAQDLQKV